MKKYAGFTFDVLKGKVFSKNIPLIVYFNITNRCNLKCTYCYGDFFNRRSKDFTRQEILNLIDELRIMGARVVYLSGGEPLLRKDIGEVIDRVKQNGMLCFMNSNGLLVPKKLDEIKKLDGLILSLDGTEEVNDKSRGTGTYKKVIAAIKAAKNSGLNVAVTSVINKDTLNSIDHIISLASEMGFSAEFNLPYAQSQGNKNHPIMCLDDSEIKAVLHKLIGYQKKGAPMALSNSTREYALSWPFSYKKKIIFEDVPADFRYLNCYMGRFMCLIDSDGFIYPCGQLIGNFPALNIKKVGFKKAWDHLIKERKCKTCYEFCFNEFNFVFDMNPKVLFSNAIRFLKKL